MPAPTISSSETGALRLQTHKVTIASCSMPAPRWKKLSRNTTPSKIPNRSSSGINKMQRRNNQTAWNMHCIGVLSMFQRLNYRLRAVEYFIAPKTSIRRGASRRPNSLLILSNDWFAKR